MVRIYSQHGSTIYIPILNIYIIFEYIKKKLGFWLYYKKNIVYPSLFSFPSCEFVNTRYISTSYYTLYRMDEKESKVFACEKKVFDIIIIYLFAQ